MSLIYSQCYHGTTVENKEKIIEKKEFKYYKREDHWLGQGVYFFIEDKEKAKWFTKTDSRTRDKEKCVICVPVEVETEELLNLDIESDRKKLDQFISDVLSRDPLIKKKHCVNNNTNNVHRCFFIDLFIKYFTNYKAVKYTFTDDKVTYLYVNQFSESKGKDKNFTKVSNNGIQLCVIKQEIINFDKMSVECI